MSYEELGGSGDDVEEGWSEGQSRRGEAARRREEDAGIKEHDDGAVNRPDYAGRSSRVHVPTEIVQGRGVQLQAHLAEGQMDIDGGNEVQAKDKEVTLKEEEERRRKGKGIMIGDMGGPGTGGRERSPIISGSGSCDPNDVGAQHGSDKLTSEEADSKAGPTVQLGEGRDKPIVISEESHEDFDLGGEGGKAPRVEPSKVGAEPSRKKRLEKVGVREGSRFIRDLFNQMLVEWEGAKRNRGRTKAAKARLGRSHLGLQGKQGPSWEQRRPLANCRGKGSNF